MAIVVIVLSAALFICGYRWWLQQQQQWRSSAAELETLICEAKMVSQDMEAILNSVVETSCTLISDMDNRIQEVRNLPPIYSADKAPQYADPIAQFYRDLLMKDHPAETDSSPQPAKDSPAPTTDDLPMTALLDDHDYQAYRHMHPTLAVHQLYQRGQSIKQIAQILQRGQGEIQLILNLASKRKPGQARSKV